jgi:hypothetical protein
VFIVLASMDSFPGGLLVAVVGVILVLRWIFREMARAADAPGHARVEPLAAFPSRLRPTRRALAVPAAAAEPSAPVAPAKAVAESPEPAPPVAESPEPPATDPPLADDPTAEAAAERLRAALADLDRRRDLGLLSDDAYEQRRARLIRDA